jgi:superfamily II DNA or RNA helicase
MTQPEFLTNEDGQTVADGISWLLNNLRQSLSGQLNLSISTAYLNPGGFTLVADPLEHMDAVRLLFGADPDASTSKIRQLSDQFNDLDSERISGALEGQTRTMEEDRNILGFNFEADESAKRLINWLRSGKVQVRRYESGFLHGKAWIVSNPTSSVIAGSSNFTRAGLSTNKELNLGQYQPGVVNQVQKWFDRIWDDSKEFDLASLFASRYDEHSPYLIYIRMLWERYGTELEQIEKTPSGGINLTSFQEDGVARARQILAKYRGVLIADGVGLGKSFTAGALIREAIIERRQRVLLVAPAALRDGPWRAFQNHYNDFRFECISFEQLRDDITRISDGGDPQHMRSRLDEYALVVVDEAHGYRNPDADRSASLRQLLQGTPPKNLVLLTATPVNNSIWDLYYILGYFLKNDSVFAGDGIRSLRNHFKSVASKDPDDLTPKELFDVLDSVAVRRTRHFVKSYYAGDTIEVNGEKQTIRFPQPTVLRSDYDLDSVLPGFFDQLELALDASIRDDVTFRIPDNMIGTALSLARYLPSSYRNNPDPQAKEFQISGLLLSGLLKRFESSSHAFANTCRRMADAHEQFAVGLDQGLVLRGDSLSEWTNSETDDVDEFLDAETAAEKATLYDVQALSKAVKADKKLLEDWAATAETVSPNIDPKLARLVDNLAEIAARAKAEAASDQEERNKRKTLIFSYYADTAIWINDHLQDVVRSDSRLAAFRDRITIVSGDTSGRESAIFGFAPESTESPTGNDRYDILVSTDVLAEGVNLQQAQNIINYDLPWNPMRLVQRHGRIDRIGSPHTRVFLRCFFPDVQLDRLLLLENRLKNKLATAAAGVGLENEVLPGTATVDVNFTQTREEIEKLRQQNPELFESSGELQGATSGEEYRQDLRAGIKNSRAADQMKDLAWGSGSGKSANGGIPGYVFCVRIGNREEPMFRFVSYENEDEPEVIADTLSCLAHAQATESTERVLDQAAYARAYDAWTLAKQDVFERWQFLTHPANIQPIVPRAMRDAIEILREYQPENLKQPELDRLLSSLEGDYGIRIQRRLRSEMESVESKQDKANQIAKVVRELGLEPSAPPKPLQPITQDDVHLICWMAIS